MYIEHKCTVGWVDFRCLAFEGCSKRFTKFFLNKIIFFCTLFCKFKNPERFAHSLFLKEQCEWIAQITHDKRATVSKWLRSHTKNEPIACFFQGWEFAHLLITHLSFRLNQMSNCKRFAQIPQDKWATVSKSFRLLISKERPWANRSGCSWQMSNREWFAQVTHDKWAICSKTFG